MASDFLSNLGDILSQQFDVGNNKNHSLDIVHDGTTQKYGKLGDFATRFDQSADRSYTEEGSFKSDLYNPTPKQLDILMQEPDTTILVKKRAFASLAENFRPDLMDAQEQLFYKATKILFQNKCKQISAYEKLSKISRISTEIGQVNYNLLPIIFAATDTLTQLPGALGLNDVQNSLNGSLSGFKSIIDRVREITAFSTENYQTTWVTNIPDTFRTSFGEGTGVIELTTVTSLSTNTTLKFGTGSFNLTFADPYELMLITNADVEQAINDATNRIYNNAFVQLGISSLDETITLQKRFLTLQRVGRGANPIIFLVEPETFLGKRIRAIIDSLGFEINFDASSIGSIIGTNNIDPSAKKGSSELGNEGLTDNEVDIFNNIVSMLYNQMSITANSRRAAIQNNSDPALNLNSVRKKLRLHYANKLIIQPMDNVHIYIGSKKKIDNEIVGGLQSSFSGQGFLQGVNNLVRDIKDTLGFSASYALEKSIFVGDDFPNWLWLAMRNQFVSDKSGSHIFAGIVNEASSSYSNGSYSARISGTDNAGYFTYGVVNFKPSTEVFNGALYDPMTPFKLEFDSTTGVVKDEVPELLDENKAMFQSAFVKNKNGLFAGLKPTENNFMRQDADRVKNNSVRRVFYDPEGMVYRWKEGVASLVLFGDSYESNSVNNQAPAITNNPFAGQDIMNTLSLLITGEPYNFTTFYKSAIQFDNFKKDTSTNQDPSASYFKGLQTQLKAQNSTYGNFVPYKRLTVDDGTYQKILNNQINAINFDADLQELLKKRASLADKLAVLGKTDLLPGAANANALQGGDQDIANTINDLDTQINDRVSKIKDELSKINKPITIVGDDISFDYDTSNINSGGDKNRLERSRQELRRKLAFLTRRLAWKVRANEDVNLLIVDDSYDKDYDIQAFEKSFTNPELFKSEYTTVADKITTVCNVIRDLEIFANTQGHIEIRNPQYNRMPSSVFYKMIRRKNDLGVQVFPQFLEDLFVNQYEQLLKEIEVLEDEIRLFCLALGNVSDPDCVVFINTSDNIISGLDTMGGFRFVSEEETGRITNAIADFNLVSQPDMLFSYIQQKLSAIEPQTNINVFSIASRATLIKAPISPLLVSESVTSTTIDRNKTISDRLEGQTGTRPDLKQLFPSANAGTANVINIGSMDTLKISNEIATRLSSRQRAIKLAANALRSLKEGLSLFNGSGGKGDKIAANPILLPDLYDNKSIPKVFEHMIEDESYDDLGVGSGSRYVIKNRDIISYNISEKRPDFTSVEVVGRMGDNFISNNELPSDLNVFTNGNALVTAAAIDYDLWRMYGLTVPQSVDAPYLSDPNTQCAPYAVSLLNRARKEILSGSIEIVGNEYQQPGEVIYIENRDLLFYVESVSHNFSYGRSFNTSLSLKYGHNPGEYIPTFLDVIGKALYNNKDITKFVHKKQGNVFNQEHLGTICGSIISGGITNSLTTGDIDFSPENDIINGQFGNANRLALQNIIEHGDQMLASTSSNMTPTLEIRVYYNSSVGDFSSPNDYAVSLRDTVKDYLIGKNDLHGNAKPSGSANSNIRSLSAFKDSNQIQSIEVDGNKDIKSEFRYPSNKAFYYARQALNSSSAGLSGSAIQQQQKIDNVIYNYIVDCWIIFKNPAIK